MNTITIVNRYYASIQNPLWVWQGLRKQTGHSVDTRLMEHQWHIRLEDPGKSAVAEHNVDLGHRIQFHNNSILATNTRYTDRIVREATEI
jgi:hypothetical protein